MVQITILQKMDRNYMENNMKHIDDYIEFGCKTGDSVLNNISDVPILGKEKVLNYLKSAPKAGIRCQTLYDYVEGVLLSPAVWAHSDGEYRWNDEEIYHFEKYNMILNIDFLKKVLG